MRILINTSNLKVGGGVQVADSICRELYKYTQHTFVIVVSDALKECANDIRKYPNIKVVCYNLPSSILSAISGNNVFLDTLISKENTEAVLTVFGPSRWVPKCLHISGFARSQLVLNDSPYWQTLSLLRRIKAYSRKFVMTYLFRKSTSVFYTENSYISAKLKRVFPNSRVYTITNNYNQVFDKPDLWDYSIKLPEFAGLTLLTISANYPHKNLSIILPTIHYLKKYDPSFKFRFVLTISSEQFLPLSNEEKEHIIFLGPVNINQCPYLYKQSDIMFLPTLLECFSASYAEAMRMDIPIITPNLDFARSLCGDTALYYDAVSSKALAETIYQLGNDMELQRSLVHKGHNQLLRFDTYKERTRKLILILEQELNNLPKT